MPSDKITNHADNAIARLPSFVQGQTNWRKLARTLATAVQTWEGTADDVLNLRHLSAATGAQLDGIGEILNLERRPTQTDGEYRDALRTHFALLFRSGEPETLIQLYKQILEATEVQIQEIFPATVQLTAFTESVSAPLLDQNTIDIMNEIKAAGVNLILQYVAFDMFTLAKASETDANGNGPSDTDHGFGSSVAGQTDGGRLSRTIG